MLVDLEEKFLAILSLHTAGSPTDEKVKWTYLTPIEIATELDAKHGIGVSNGLVKRLLAKHGYGRRKMSKSLPIGSYAHRDEQFRLIFYLVLIVSTSRNAIVSIDTKKKERLGNLYREGKAYSTAPVKVYDHDYGYLAEGKIIPHGIYDLKRNEGYVSIGSSHETASFICDNLEWWWHNYGIHHYPGSKYMLLLCDSGGANGYRHHQFKKQLQILARKIGLKIIVTHYPPYSSKWNPIEHRLFAHVHRAMQGVVFTDYALVRELVMRTKTKTGLTVFARIVTTPYQIGVKCAKQEVDESRILTHPHLPLLNYTILP